MSTTTEITKAELSRRITADGYDWDDLRWQQRPEDMGQHQRIERAVLAGRVYRRVTDADQSVSYYDDGECE